MCINIDRDPVEDLGAVYVRFMCGVCAVYMRCLCGFGAVYVRCLCGFGAVYVRCLRGVALCYFGATLVRSLCYFGATLVRSVCYFGAVYVRYFRYTAHTPRKYREKESTGGLLEAKQLKRRQIIFLVCVDIKLMIIRPCVTYLPLHSTLNVDTKEFRSWL